MKSLGRVALVAGPLVLVLAGCGLKGALEMPEKSSRIVIRGPQSPGTTTAPGTASPPANEQTTTVPADDRMPPPPLPSGNPGSSG